MSVRHTPRQAERDVRLHEPHAVHPHPLNPQQPPPPPPSQAHLNGNGLGPAASSAVPIPNGTAPHPHQLPSHISPKAPPPASANMPESIQKLVSANEQTWLVIGPSRFHHLGLSARLIRTASFPPGSVAEQMGDLEHALSAYENALRHNAYSIPGLTQVAGIARVKENFQMVRPHTSIRSGLSSAAVLPR
jgi:glucose repression mediator protein